MYTKMQRENLNWSLQAQISYGDRWYYLLEILGQVITDFAGGSTKIVLANTGTTQYNITYVTCRTTRTLQVCMGKVDQLTKLHLCRSNPKRCLWISILVKSTTILKPIQVSKESSSKNLTKNISRKKKKTLNKNSTIENFWTFWRLQLIYLLLKATRKKRQTPGIGINGTCSSRPSSLGRLGPVGMVP